MNARTKVLPAAERTCIENPDWVYVTGSADDYFLQTNPSARLGVAAEPFLALKPIGFNSTRIILDQEKRPPLFLGKDLKHGMAPSLGALSKLSISHFGECGPSLHLQFNLQAIEMTAWHRTDVRTNPSSRDLRQHDQAFVDIMNEVARKRIYGMVFTKLYLNRRYLISRGLAAGISASTLLIPDALYALGGLVTVSTSSALAIGLGFSEEKIGQSSVHRPTAHKAIKHALYEGQKPFELV